MKTPASAAQIFVTSSAVRLVDSTFGGGDELLDVSTQVRMPNATMNTDAAQSATNHNGAPATDSDLFGFASGEVLREASDGVTREKISPHFGHWDRGAVSAGCRSYEHFGHSRGLIIAAWYLTRPNV